MTTTAYGKGKSPYAKYGKRETDYTGVYARAPHLKARPASYHPEVSNPYYNPPKGGYSDVA